MENGANGGSSAGSASPAEQMIPKSRLDEVLAERNRLREERNLQDRTVQTLSQLLQRGNPRAQAPQVHPVVKKLQEEGRNEEAAAFQQMLNETRQMRQAQAALVDEVDRSKFLTQYGPKGGAEALRKVEEIVEAERARGNFNVTREGAFLWMKGQENLLRDERAASQAQAPQAAPPAPRAPQAEAAYEEDAPSSNPADIATLRQSGASETWAEKSREERIKDLENIEF